MTAAAAYIDQLSNAVPALLEYAGQPEIRREPDSNMVAVGTLGMLRAAGVDARIVAGAMLYRAGPHPSFDVVAFCGRDNKVELSGGFAVWVEATASDGRPWLVDFSAQYWRQSAFGTAWWEPVYGDAWREPGWPGINWMIPPPAYYFGPKAELVYRLQPGERTPPLGRLWLQADTELTRVIRCETEELLRDRSLYELRAPAGDAA